MRDPERCLADGYTTAGTLGVGLGAVKRMATHFTIRSTGGADAGTWACARLTAPGEQRPEWQGVGAVCLPAEGEESCGDARAIVDTDAARTAAVLDGLGHGRPPPRRPRRRCGPSTPTPTGRCRRCSTG
ncbi:hypothetical protein ACFQ2Y_28315 [Streptomyces malaysiensis subsp. malaysiensis]